MMNYEIVIDFHSDTSKTNQNRLSLITLA